MSKIGKEIFTSLDLNGPYIRLDTQPTSVTTESVHGNGGTGRESRYTATFTTAASVYFMIGDSSEVGDDNIIEEDAVAPTANSSGTIIYQWYEMVNSEPNLDIDFKLEEGTSNKLPTRHRSELNNTNIETTGANFSGTTSTTLTITDLQSPGDNVRQFYCLVDYKVSDNSSTGNTVNGNLITNVATLTVLPHIVIDEQPIGGESQITEINTISFSSRLSDNRFQNDFTYQWYEVSEDGVDSALQEGIKYAAPLVDGTRTVEFITQGERVEDYTKTTIDELHVPFTDNDGNLVYGSRVGIPTQVTEVIVKVSGASGGKGGDEGQQSGGGNGGSGRYAEFKFSDELISRINNSDVPQDFTIFAGSAGGQGPSRTNEIDSFGEGGICASTYDGLRSSESFDTGSAGDGGHAGPDGLSGAGGGGGGFSGIYDIEEERWLAIAGGGGGGGGGSELRPGEVGEDAGIWEEIVANTSTSRTTSKQATVVNFNPTCTEVSGETVKIDYGFYTKTTNSSNSVSLESTFDRIVIIWDGDVKVDAKEEISPFSASSYLSSDDDGIFYQIGNLKYYVGTHRGSQLGWCDDDNDCGVCTRLKSEADDEDERIDIQRFRKTGGYVNSFDIIRVEVAVDEDSDDYNDIEIYGAYGINGADKLSGDGGGGGGGGAGAFTESRGGNAGTDPINNATIQITVSNAVNSNIEDNQYIRFIPVDGVGGTIEFSKLTNPGTSNITFMTGGVYDVVSSLDEGITSEGIRVLPDLSRSIGLDLSGSLSPDEIPSDILLSLGDGVFRTVPRTVFVDGEFVGTSIIQFTTPTENSVNQTAAEGGEGGRSAYLFDNENSYHLEFQDQRGLTLNDAQGHVELKFTTKEPFDILNDNVEEVSFARYHSHSGTRTQELNTNSEYTFSKFYKCRIFSEICKPIPVLDTNTVMLSMTDNARNILFVEAIGTDNFAYTYSRNLSGNSGIDVDLYPSAEIGTNKVRYYSFYTKYNTDVDIRLYGGKGKDKTYGTTTYSGGLGGMSYFRLRMKANTEYVIAGLDSTINTPFLFEKGTLLAAVGSGGDAGNVGHGGVGSGINVKGGDAPNNGGTGAQRYTTLGENGRYGSASIATIFSPGDDKASGNAGGYTKKCTTGKYWAEDANPTVSPCSDIPGNSKFRLDDGTEVINTAEITRGFKDGYNIFFTGGSGQTSGGNGGNGVGGGSGSNNGRGGGGGSGYANQSSTFFLRDSTLQEWNNRGFAESPDGTYSGSASGVNSGQPRVQISLAEIQSNKLKGFNAYPDDIVVGSDQLELLEQLSFKPLPIIEVPGDAATPILRKRILNDIKITSTNLIENDRTLPPVGQSLDVGEGEKVKIFFQTEKIPPNSTFYWKLIPFDASFTSDDVDNLQGEFTTSFIGDDPSSSDYSTCEGSFEFTISSDFLTEFTSSVERFGVSIYSDSNRRVLVSSLDVKTFNVIDRSRSAPTARITTTPVDMSEGQSQTFFVETTDIPLYPAEYNENSPDYPGNVTLNWEIVNITTTDDEFIATSGTFLIAVNDIVNSVTGTGSFIVYTKEDFTTEGESHSFSLRISYSLATQHPNADSTLLFDGTDESTPYTVNILDSSRDPVYTLTPQTASINEHLDTFASGDTQTYTLNTEFVRPNSQFYFQVVSGHDNTDTTASIETSDFITASGNFTVTADSDDIRTPSGTFTVQSRPDALVETTENFTVQVYKRTSGDYLNATLSPPSVNSLIATSNLTVNNTTENLYLFHESGDETITSKTIDEGESLTLNVYGRFVPGYPNSRTIYWKIYKSNGSSEADSTDWDSTTGSVTLSQTGNEGNIAFTITPTNDLTTDDDDPEQFFVKLSLNSNMSPFIQAGTDQSSDDNPLQFEVNVIDTSRNPIFKFLPDGSESSSFTMDEGNSKTLNLTIENVTPSTTFYWEIITTHSTSANSRTTASSGDSGDWVAARGTVTSDATFDEQTLPIIITARADQTTETSNDGLFQIRVTTVNYYSESGAEVINTGSNENSIDNDGRITITIRDTSKTPATYTLSPTGIREEDEGDSESYTIRAFNDTRGGIDSSSSFDLYYSVVYTGTSDLATADVETPYGTASFSYYTSSSSTGSIEHRSSISVRALVDVVLDGSDEVFDLLLFATENASQSPVDNTPVNRFSQFFRIDDTSFPQYAINQSYNTSPRHDSTLQYDEGEQDDNGNPLWYNIYIYSNSTSTLYWTLTYPQTAAALNWNTGAESESDNTNYYYKSSVSCSNLINSSFRFTTSNPYTPLYYGLIQFWSPRDFNISSNVGGTFRLYSDSDRTNEVKSTSITITNRFSSVSAPVIYNIGYSVQCRGTGGAYGTAQQTHYYTDSMQAILIDRFGDVYVKGAQSVSAVAKIYSGNTTYVQKTWSRTGLKWLDDDADSSTDLTTHYLTAIFDDWEDYEFSPVSGDYDGYSFSLTITATNPGGSTTKTKTRTLDYTPPPPTPEPEPEPVTPTPTTPTPTTPTPTPTAPTISLSLSSVAATFGGNATNGYTVTAGTETAARLVLSWTIGGGAATSGTASGSGFNNTYYNSDDTLDATGTWYTGDGQDGGRLKAVARGTNAFTLTWTMSVANAVGSAEDEVSLTVSSLDAPPEYTYTPHVLYLFRRIANRGIGDRYRYAIGTCTKTNFTINGREYDRAAAMGYVYRNDGGNKVPAGSKAIKPNGLVFVCIDPGGTRENFGGYYAYPMNTNGTLVDNPTVNPSTTGVKNCAIYADTRNGDIRKGVDGLAIDITDTHPKISSSTDNRFALFPSTQNKYTDGDVSRIWTFGNDATYSSKVATGGVTAGRWKIIDEWTEPTYNDLAFRLAGIYSVTVSFNPSLSGSGGGSSFYYDASWTFYKNSKRLTAIYREGTNKSNTKIVSWNNLSDLAKLNLENEYFKILGFDRPEPSGKFVKNWIRVDSNFDADDFGGYYRWKLVSSNPWITADVTPIT